MKNQLLNIFYYFPLDNTKLENIEFLWKHEYLVISWFSPGTEGRLSGPMDQVSGFESEVSRLDSHLGSWVAVWHTAISAANGYLYPIYQPTQKKEKSYKKNKNFLFQNQKIVTLAIKFKKWQRFCLIDFQIFCCSDVLPDVRFPPFFCENGFSIFLSLQRIFFS